VIIEFHLPDVDVRRLNVLVRALTALNVQYLREHPSTPLLKASGVRYATQPIGCERFLTIPTILQRGNADCDQLAPWRAAELREHFGIKALPEVKQMGEKLWHVYVRLPDGRVEDISAHLGMPVPAKLAALGRRIIAERERKHASLAAYRIAAARRRIW